MRIYLKIAIIQNKTSVFLWQPTAMFPIGNNKWKKFGYQLIFTGRVMKNLSCYCQLIVFSLKLHGPYELPSKRKIQ